MKHIALVLLLSYLGHALGLLILPYAQVLEHNSLYEILADVSDSVPVVSSLNELTAKKLMRYSVLKVNDTQSIIVSNKLVLQLDNSPYSVDAPQSQFLEILYNDSYASPEENRWSLLGPCHSNLRSDTATEVVRSWTISGESSVLGAVSISQIFGISPLLLLTSKWGTSASGSVSCIVGPRQMLQFLIYTDSLFIEGVKQRTIDLRWPYLFSSSLKVGKWENVTTITKVKKAVKAACVTDPQLMQCS